MKKDENKKSFREDFKLIKRGVKITRELIPRYFSYMLIFSLCTAIVPFVSIYYTAAIISEISGACNRDTLIRYVALMAGIEFVLTLFSKLGWRHIRVNQIISNFWEDIYLNKKSFSMDYGYMERADVRTLRQGIVDNRSLGGLGSVIMGLMSVVRSGVSVITSAVMMAGILFIYSGKQNTGILAFADSGWSALFLAVITAAFTVYLVKDTVKQLGKVYDGVQQLPKVRRLSRYYIDDYLDDNKAGKDVRIYNQGNLILDASREMVRNYIVLWKEIVKHDYGANEHNQYVKIILNGFVYIVVILKVLAGAFDVGVMVEYVSLVSAFASAVAYFTGTVIRLRANNRYLEKVYEFLDLPSSKLDGKRHVATGEHEIRFENVSFRYPEAESYALKNLTMTFRQGERMAVVGMNGSGKTTMIKLLCRLYDPESGRITLDGTDIREYDYGEYLRLFSVVFQDFRLFSLSVGQNVAANSDYDAKRVWDCLEKAGLYDRVKSFPNGLDTAVYKDFDENGIEISGGEAQKLAIARALYKDAPFVILDEPTAALDPISEYDIYSRFNQIIGGKTAVYISHRLSSCRFCDRIAVFHEGQLIQQGAHEELLRETDGKYAELWNAQAQYYAESAEVC